ncbi:hypothetical protein SAMN05216387_101220 [Nitrosovibrio tenuis]|uniref:Uncharacterized protein n=1 Tax=Nitrosovibrio tenuis TaxID=1233 RepID=A0A1H7G9G7_9PROT|nr:hypothetical protein SAMN05216387_101220 [Nitrosovibrio tenuis]
MSAEPLSKSYVNMMAALRDAMREGGGREWPTPPFTTRLVKQTARKAPSRSGCSKMGRDRAGRSSAFQRKVRPRSGMQAPINAVAAPDAARPRFPQIPGGRFGRDRAGRSSAFQRKVRPRSGMQAPTNAVAAPDAARFRFPQLPGRRFGRDRAGRSSAFQRKVRPRSGMQAPTNAVAAPDATRFRFPLRGDPRATLWAPLCCTPWHRRPHCGLGRPPYDYPNGARNAHTGDLFRGSLC